MNVTMQVSKRLRIQESGNLRIEEFKNQNFHESNKPWKLNNKRFQGSKHPTMKKNPRI